MAVSCNYKLLKNAHIGCGIRMTKDKNTIPFANEPMTGMQIENYTKLGFQISHPNMGKTIWVEFKQLPLTKLTIKNGKILDEITFVENIVAHQMELIKTSWFEYQELVQLEKEEKLEEFTTLSKIKPGEVVISALCKEGTAMVYLGTWFTKNVYRKHERSWGYSKMKNNDTFFLEKQSPRRAFFIVDTDDLSEKEKDLLRDIKQDDFEKEGRDWKEKWELYKNAKKQKETEIRDFESKERFKIIAYPVTSKVIKKLVKTNVFNDKFINISYNKQMILNISARKDGNYYHGNKPASEYLAELKEEYPRVEMNNFLITNPYYSLDHCKFLTLTKDNINKRAYNWINENLKCSLQLKLWVGRDHNPIDFNYE